MECLKCDGSIVFDEIFDTDTTDDYHVEYCTGHCSKCLTEYQWKELYEFTEQTDLQIIE